jgi:hypothetical protein
MRTKYKNIHFEKDKSIKHFWICFNFFNEKIGEVDFDNTEYYFRSSRTTLILNRRNLLDIAHFLNQLNRSKK